MASFAYFFQKMLFYLVVNVYYKFNINRLILFETVYSTNKLIQYL